MVWLRHSLIKALRKKKQPYKNSNDHHPFAVSSISAEVGVFFFLGLRHAIDGAMMEQTAFASMSQKIYTATHTSAPIAKDRRPPLE